MQENMRRCVRCQLPVRVLLRSSRQPVSPKPWTGATRWDLHDTMVPDVSSDTFGINGSLSVDKRTDAGRHYFGSFDLFVDNDQDHLDPDHIPIWWMLHVGTDGRFWQPGNGGYAGWTADLNTRMNTVSSIERQIKVLPAIVLGYDGDRSRPRSRAVSAISSRKSTTMRRSSAASIARGCARPRSASHSADGPRSAWAAPVKLSGTAQEW